MKTLRINVLQLLTLLLVIVMLTPACSQSDKSTSTKSAVDKPEMDIHTAVLSNDLNAVRQHIETGTDIDTKEPFGGSTPLITAVTFDKQEIAKALIEAGADLTIANKEGSTPLHSAAFFCRVELVKMLLDAKADKTIKNKFGATPRETVMGPFAEIKPIYEMLQKQLEPMGLQLDLARLEEARPVISMMLQ